MLLQILDNEHIFTTIICSHNYKYLPELKQRAENLILFAPQTLQHDFASYNTLLNKLNANEFIIYGALTQNVPFIVELSEFSTAYEKSSEKVNENTVLETNEEVTEHVEETPVQASDNVYDFDIPDNIETPEEEPSLQDEEPVVIEEEPAIEPELSHDELVEQVAKDVDEVFYTQPQQTPSIEEITSPDTITEDDLNFIDDLSIEQPMEEEHPLGNNDFEVTDEFPFEEEHRIEEPSSDIPEEIPAQDETVILEEEPVLEDIPTEFEIDNSSDDMASADELLDEPQPPVVPIYPSDEPVLDSSSPSFEQGDMVSHPKYGKGVIEKLIKYGNKTLCSISFENVGRRLLDPAISELQKVD